MSDLLPPSHEEPSQELLNKANAANDLDDILHLRKSVSFNRYFLRRLSEKMEPLAAALLRKKMTPEEFAEKQTRLAVLEEIARMLDDDELGNRSILKP